MLSVQFLKDLSHSADYVILLINVLAWIRVEIVYLLQQLLHVLPVVLTSSLQLMLLLKKLENVAVYQFSIV